MQRQHKHTGFSNEQSNGCSSMHEYKGYTLLCILTQKPIVSFLDNFAICEACYAHSTLKVYFIVFAYATDQMSVSIICFKRVSNLSTLCCIAKCVQGNCKKFFFKQKCLSECKILLTFRQHNGGKFNQYNGLFI